MSSTSEANHRDATTESLKSSDANCTGATSPGTTKNTRVQSSGGNCCAVIACYFHRSDQVSLVRTCHTDQHRAGMDVRDRRKTVENVFKVWYPALIEAESVLLVDDVFTTGATVSSCAQALREAGAAEVFVLTLARPVTY